MSNDIEKLRELKREFIDKAIASGIQYSTCGQFSNALNKAIESLAAPASPAAPSGELHNDYKEIARLIGSIYYAGNFIAETHNERELEALLVKTGHRYMNWGEVEYASLMAEQGKDSAIAHQPPKAALTLQKLNELAANHIKDIAGYERPIEPMGEDHEFIILCRAIEAASAPNKQLVEALQLVVDRFGPSESDYIFSKRFALKKARAALASAGVPLKGE